MRTYANKTPTAWADAGDPGIPWTPLALIAFELVKIVGQREADAEACKDTLDEPYIWDLPQCQRY